MQCSLKLKIAHANTVNGLKCLKIVIACMRGVAWELQLKLKVEALKEFEVSVEL